ncbi:hypothetical protein [Azospirillum sp. B4]|uniref:hypothetical protein n=1 Tax=Azospirillum sp. B4 TaxID=95605 RepID=UPI000347FE93|nr:hypothetical protein [Azospirillum sp. B4]
MTMLKTVLLALALIGTGLAGLRATGVFEVARGSDTVRAYRAARHVSPGARPLEELPVVYSPAGR